MSGSNSFYPSPNDSGILATPASRYSYGATGASPDDGLLSHHQPRFDADGILNDTGLSYLNVPLASPLARDEEEEIERSRKNEDIEKEKPKSSTSQRLQSLDCFRGLVIAWMIMSDETGTSWTHTLDHSPWNGIHFADFVFPAFVFVVGLVIPMSTSKYLGNSNDKWQATKHAFIRTIKMFIVGFLSASGGFPQPADEYDPRDWTTYNTYRLKTIRIPGILQRISFCYFVCVCVFIWFPTWNWNKSEDQSLSRSGSSSNSNRFHLYLKYIGVWISALVLTLIYLILTFGTNVPGCKRGSLVPECNASRYWDEQIIGKNHMYRWPTLNRSPDCSANTPGYDPIPGAPEWCRSPYDPEGVLGTFTASVTGLFGLFFGLILVNEKQHLKRVIHWLSLSAVCMVLGLIIHFTCIPINKNLWSLSYVLVMVGVDGVVFTAFYWCVDMKLWRRALFPMMCMGMNAILVFVFAQSDISLGWLIRLFYLDSPDQNLYDFYRQHVLISAFGKDWGIFLWGWTKVAAWLGISVLLFRKKIFWKL